MYKFLSQFVVSLRVVWLLEVGAEDFRYALPEGRRNAVLIILDYVI